MASNMEGVKKVVMIEKTHKALCQYNKENHKHIICN